MRYFELLNIQHFVLYLFPALLTVVLIGIGLAFTHVRRKDSEEKMNKVRETYVGGIEERNAPFPLILTLTLLGTVIWVILYILFVGGLGVRI